MAVTILERPQGQVLSTTGIAAKIDDAYGSPDATVYSVGHGLSDGEFVYITSNIEDYNGFFYVDSTGSDTFKIKQYSAGDFVQFVQDTDITYYVSTLSHGWSAVHLPITYRLSSNLYPTNTVDTIRNINSVVDENGYLLVNTSGSLGTIHSYDSVYITLPNDTEYSGVYSIVEWISNTVMVLNLSYDSAINFTGATIQKYYNNYNILVRVYAGIATGHEWAAKKPMELAATLQLIPDENGEVFFSVNEILKSYIEIRNNLLLGTLPNNIGFWNNFYIEYAESYDDADGYALGTYTSSYTSDSNFVGYSVNAKLEFKNLYSGYMSEYLMNNNTAKFLTLFAIPVLFGCTDDYPDCYNEVTFIKSSSSDFVLNKQYYSNGNAGLLEQETISGDEGLYRVPITPNCDYDRVDLSLSQTQVLTNTDFDGLSPWVILNNSAFFSAAYGSNSVIFSFLTGGVSGTNDLLTQSFTPVLGYSYSFNYTINIANYVTGNVRMNIRFLDSSDTQITAGSYVDYTANGTYSGTVIIQENSQANIDQITKVAFAAIITSSSDGNGPIVTLTHLDTTGPTTFLSETKQYKIDCGCSPQELRLTWLNNLGGFDYWNFKAEKDLLVEVSETGETRKNIFPTWPKSYGANADTIRKQTFRDTNKAYTVRSQFVTEDEIDALAYIKSSVLVQIINSRQDRRTVIVDADSFIIRADGDKTHSIAFNVSFTDDIPSQTV